MSLKVFLILAPVALGGYYVANRDAAPAEGAKGPQQVKAAAPRKSEAECRQIEQNMLEESEANPAANGFEGMRRVNAMYYELRRQGCNPGNGGPNFEGARNAMGTPPRAGPGGTSFEAGRPMVDVSRDRSR
jgi:hypothetical protein